MIIGRTKEIKEFHNHYYRNAFQLHLILGDYKIGKTHFVKEILVGKKCIYFSVSDISVTDLLSHFTRILFEQYPDYRLGVGEVFKNWDELFSYLSELTMNRKMIIVIDNFEKLINNNSEILDILKNMINSKLRDTQMCLMLVGTSNIEEHIRKKKSNMSQYVTSTIQLDKLTYNESCQFIDNWTNKDKLYAYGVTGGNPTYLVRFSLYENFRDAIISELIKNNSFLRNQILSIITNNFREPAIYNSIINAISNGALRQSEIASKINRSTNDVAVYLKKLIDAKIINKEYPFEESDKKVNYKVSNALLNFWFRFVSDYIELTIIGSADRIYDKFIEPKVSDYFEECFVEVCNQFLRDEVNDFDQKYITFSLWWDYDKQSKRYIIYSNRKSVLVASCQLGNKNTNQQELDLLKEVGNKVSKGRNIQYVLITNQIYGDDIMENLLIYNFE